LDIPGLVNSINNAAIHIDSGRKGFAIQGKQQYQGVEKSIPHDTKYRFSGYPKDSFHIACISHKTRIQNILKSPGIDPIEKALLKQRASNLSTAQNGYVEKQKKILTN
jgi:hypothetical protein